MAMYGKHVDYRLETKNMAGFRFTGNRRPYNGNSKNIGPMWMTCAHSMDTLNWMSAGRINYINQDINR